MQLTTEILDAVAEAAEAATKNGSLPIKVRTAMLSLHCEAAKVSLIMQMESLLVDVKTMPDSQAKMLKALADQL